MDTKVENIIVHRADAKQKSVEEIFNTLTDEQKEAVYFLIGMALQKNNGAK